MKESREKALEKAKKHTHREGKDGKCSICGKDLENVENEKGKAEEKEENKPKFKLDEKGRKPKKEFGAKNNDSQED
jgi:transcription initiation factor IIE alpha subunit